MSAWAVTAENEGTWYSGFWREVCVESMGRRDCPGQKASALWGRGDLADIDESDDPPAAAANLASVT